MKTQSITKKKNSSKFWVYFFPVFLFFLSLGVNLLFFSWKDAPVYYNDSTSYINVASQIKNFSWPDLSYRPPVYPLYVALTSYHQNYLVSVLIQTMIGALTIVLLYFILNILTKSKVFSFFASALMVFDLQVLTFQSTLLTETLTIFLVMLSVLVHLRYWKPSKWSDFVLWFLADFLLVFVKPALIMMPFIFYGIKFIYFLFQKNLKIPALSVLGAILINICALFLFCSYNYERSGYFGLSTVANMNNLGKIFQYHFLDKNYNDPPAEVQNALELYKAGTANRNAYSYQELLLENGLFENSKINIINSYLIGQNKIDFVKKSLVEFPKVVKEKWFLYAQPSNSFAQKLVSPITDLFQVLNSLKVAGLVVTFFAVIVLLVRKKYLMASFLSVIFFVVIYGQLATAAFSFTEYVRVRIPVEYFGNVLFFLAITMTWQALSKKEGVD